MCTRYSGQSQPASVHVSVALLGSTQTLLSYALHDTWKSTVSWQATDACPKARVASGNVFRVSQIVHSASSARKCILQESARPPSNALPRRPALSIRFFFAQAGELSLVEYGSNEVAQRSLHRETLNFAFAQNQMVLFTNLQRSIIIQMMGASSTGWF